LIAPAASPVRLLHASGEPLLQLRLSACYPGSAPILDNVELALAPGEILGLVGRSRWPF